jgi:hypothetical protein
MLPLHEPRFWTGLIVVGVALFTISRGVDVAGFALADSSADQASMATRLAPWTTTPAVAALALSRLVRDAPGDANARRRWAADLLSRAPLDANAWVLLASLRFTTGEPAEKGVTALAMSTLTGPNEGWIMARRGVLALPLWQVLPPDSRRGAMSDLVAGGYYASQIEWTALRATLSLQTPSLREDMRAALLAAGGARFAEALGLDAPPTPARNAAPAARAP